MDTDEKRKQTDKTYEKIKRIFDISLALISLTLLSPVFIITAILICLESQGNPVYIQERIGLNGKAFKMYKFRSMYLNAEQDLELLLDLNEMGEGVAFKIKNDPRITKVGRILRRTSIDELPQLVNILKGDMSFVGPRPPLPREVKKYTPYEEQRLSVLPGLTCYWQCSGRNKIGFKEWIELDLKYIQERCLLTDLKIILKTFIAVITMDGAE